MTASRREFEGGRARADVRPASEPVAAGRDRIVIVDADAPLARALVRSLVSSSAEVVEVSDFGAAFELIDEAGALGLILGTDDEQAARFLAHLDVRGLLPELILHVENLDGPLACWSRAHRLGTVLEKPAPVPVLRDWIGRLVRKPAYSRAPGEGLGRLLGSDPSMHALREQVVRVAQFSSMPVLITGETGTGKELVAQAIHELSSPGEPIATVNCAAIPESLFEAELFGHTAGAFTNANGKRAGLFEEAGTGTVFLDEIGELPLSVQPKLLRTLETRRFRRVGANRELPLRARVISATNVHLAESPESFRPDLFFRLAGFSIHCPPLRQRRGDIFELARHFLSHFCNSYGIPTMTFGPGALDLLLTHDWPGNVRELRGVIETAAVSTSSSTISSSNLRSVLYPPVLPPSQYSKLATEAAFDELPPSLAPASRVTATSFDDAPAESTTTTRLVGEGCAFGSLPELERHVILAAYEDARGRLSRAARILGIPRSTLRDKLKRYGVDLDRVAAR